MTDRYLFRGFHPCENGTESVWIDGKEIKGDWAYGFYVDRNGMSHIYIETVDEFSQCGSWYEFIKVIPETVGQYTGLTDKNGTRIFENDIIICRQEISGNFIDTYIEFGYVEMTFGSFGLHRKIWQGDRRVDAYYRPFKDWFEDYEFEVLGNIHSNPDILERKEF